jgi:hypothetical protein
VAAINNGCRFCGLVREGAVRDVHNNLEAIVSEVTAKS